MRNVNSRTIKFVRIITRVNIKVSKISVNSAIFVIKNNQIFKCLIFKTSVIMIVRINFKSLNDNAQNKNRIIVKAVYTLSLI